ncbi:MAG: hypothetical protein WDO12_01620 [Pseudomonadota bacterium]
MAKFLVTIVDQLDFALDHLVLEDINYKRLSLVLVDNVVELVLHRYAEHKGGENRYRGNSPKNDPKLVAAALGQFFDPKVKLAKSCGFLDEQTTQTITTLHEFRNQLYHRGIVHEAILPALVLFYFRVACDVMIRYEPFGYSWGSSNRVPLRAMKYVGVNPMSNPTKDFPAAWKRLKEVSEAIPLRLVDTLHSHMEEVIEETDRLIDYVVGGAPDGSTRLDVVLDSQAWGIAFTDKGRNFAAKNGCTIGTVGGYVDWLKANYPWTIRTDPIPSWRGRLSSLKSETDDHKALRRYTEFMSQTEELREAIDRTAEALDQHVESQMGR